MSARPFQRCPHCGELHDGRVTRCPTTGRPLGGTTTAAGSVSRPPAAPPPPPPRASFAPPPPVSAKPAAHAPPATHAPAQASVHAKPPAASEPGTKDDPLVGTTLGGRYQLVRQLGDGGMGAVYKAADQVLRRFVAVKLLHPTVAQRPAAVERFQREARAAAAIGHPNIIDILDFGVDGRPYMVMEYLRGRSLSQVLGAEGALDIPRACSIAAHALAGLAAAHERGILHRDLKPANLMLVQRFGDKSFTKVCDFGFAALMGPSSAEDGKSLTPARTLVGTPAYASPERLRGDDRRDPRVDIYAMGVVLFEMIAGRRPFDGGTFRELARAVKHDPPPRLSLLRRDVPRELEEVVLYALAKQPEGRFRNAGEFAAALVPFGGRSVALDEEPSDSFTFEVWQIRQRNSRKGGTRPSIEVPLDERGPSHAPRAAIPPSPLAPPPAATSPMPPAFAPPFAPHGSTHPAPPPSFAPGAQVPGAPTWNAPPLFRGGPSSTPPNASPAPAGRARKSFPPPPRADAPDRTIRTEPLDATRAAAALGMPLAPRPAAAPAAPAAVRTPSPAAATQQLPPRASAPIPGTLPSHAPADARHGLDFDDATTADDPTTWLRRSKLPPGLAASPPERAAAVVAEVAPAVVPPRHPRIGESDEEQATEVELVVPKASPDRDPLGRVSGRALLATLRFVAGRFGERAVKDVLDSVPPWASAPFVEGVDASRWYGDASLTALVERVDALLGSDDLHLVVEVGRSLADAVLEDRRLVAQPVEVALEELPSLTESVLRGTATHVRRVGRGYARIELTEERIPSLTLAVLSLGFVERTLGRFGAGDVEVNLFSARALDDAQTLIDASWIA